MSMSVIPVTILTGFLGSGKTTLLNQLMQTKGEEKVVIIVNEFGDTSIDHELILSDERERIFQLSNGCMCCVVREDLAEMFLAILSVAKDSPSGFDRVIIETSGLAEPSPIAQTIIRTPVLSEHFVIDSILTLVDVKNAHYQLENYTEAVEQVAFADKLLLTKTDQVSTQETKKIAKELEAINPFVDKWKLNFNEIYSDLIGLDLFDHSSKQNSEIENDIEHMMENHEHHYHDHVHTPVNSFVIHSEDSFSEKHIMRWIQILIQKYGMDLMRYKGILNIEGNEKQLILQGVNMAFRIEEGEEWRNDPATKIVLIGKNLPEKNIREMLIN